MQPLDQHATVRRSEQWARFVQRNCLWLLLGCYVLATCWPGPGLMMRRWEWSTSLGRVPLSLPLLLLALLLFCAALVTDWAEVRAVAARPGVLLAGLVAVWLGPALLVLVAGAVVPWALDGQAATGLMVGLALVATMPVANSSVGWSQNAQGNLALSLGLVLVSISLSPWTTPHLLGLLGLSLAPQERALCEVMVNQFSGTFFIVWVILPTSLGFAVQALVGRRRVEIARGEIALASVAALLVLNYANAALALPKVWQQSQASVLVATLLIAIALSAVGLASGWLIARLLKPPPQAESALLFGLSMKHTGLALVLAGAVLADEPLAIFLIVLATLVQHLLAGVVQWWLQSRDAP
jgi:bile acid:Na+ symporter, BASS family